jgi:hypothetical protein
MSRAILLLVCFLTLVGHARAVRPADLLPKDVKYDPSVVTPRAYLGFDVGERHLYHHQIVGYLKKLAACPRVRVLEYGRTHAGRPLLLLIITAPANHKNLEAIRKRHLQLVDPASSASVKLDDLPATAWMGYGVHGNEPSASNVTPLVAYHLAAATGKEHEKLLQETVILLDPCINPDGFERFAHWANDNRGTVPSTDPETREHREAWPTGRTNYYHFDLNRDWLPAVQPESRARLALYHRWKPNLVLDFHEMGTASTYFFQPGAPKRVHPLIPDANRRLTRDLAKFHARALDRIGSLYFTDELFDDYYPGKGSTYPDLHGGVGILFEQASSRGQMQDSPNGVVAFPFTIRNHLTTSLSSLRGLHALRKEFLDYKRSAYRDAVEQARKGKVRAHVVAAPGDPVRLEQFVALLARHDIRAYRLQTDLKDNGQLFRAGEAFVVPTDQPEARFLQVLFERRTTFAEKVFYDISTWTLPLAFNLRHAELDRMPAETALGEVWQPGKPLAASVPLGTEDLGYLVDWRSSAAPRLLHRLLAAGVKVRAASTAFSAGNGKDAQRHSHGTLFVPLGIQPGLRSKVVELLRQAGDEGVTVRPLTDGLALEGIKPGSSAFLPIPAPRVLLVTGESTSAYEAGEVWHALDQNVGMPLTRVDCPRLGSVDLAKYTAVVLVSGTYESVLPAGIERLKRYAETGGTLIAQGTAIPWLQRNKLVDVRLLVPPKKEKSARQPYARAAEIAAEQLIRGAIFKTHIDATHPLCWGLAEGAPLPVFRNNRIILAAPADEYSAPVVYDDNPLLSGHVSSDNLKLLSGSASVAVVPAGRGRAILLADNANFRGFWPGTARLFTNAIFFGPITRIPSRLPRPGRE